MSLSTTRSASAVPMGAKKKKKKEEEDEDEMPCDLELWTFAFCQVPTAASPPWSMGMADDLAPI
jgi:hypothetical protein